MLNPKLEGSNIIDCIPIGGICPNDCQPCYYNHGDMPNRLNPVLPTMEEVGDKIVRVNSGRDSSVDFEKVIELTKQYPKKFYNTSLPTYITEFPAPVVFTCNPNNVQWFYALSRPYKIMAVRIRVCAWNLNNVDNAVEYYQTLIVPVILTFLYFNDSGLETPLITNNYEFIKHIKGNRWIIKPEVRQRMANRYGNVLQCGSSTSHICKDCGNCESLYKRAMALWF